MIGQPPFFIGFGGYSSFAGTLMRKSLCQLGEGCRNCEMGGDPVDHLRRISPSSTHDQSSRYNLLEGAHGNRRCPPGGDGIVEDFQKTDPR